MYYSDIITDIVVCFDLKEKNSYYFNTSLSIILFSVLGSACLQLFSREQLNRMNQPVIKSNLFLCGVSTLSCFCITVLSSFLINTISPEKDELNNNLVELQLMEALLESGPEAIFQPFILMQAVSEHSQLSFLRYSGVYYNFASYLVYVMVNYEIKKYQSNVKNFRKRSKDQCQKNTLKNLKIGVYLLFAYRLRDIFARKHCMPWAHLQWILRILCFSS